MTRPSGRRPGEVIRPLGRGERFNWLIDRVYCSNFVVVAEVEGAFEPEAFARELNRARARHPLLDTRITVRGRRVVLTEGPGNDIEVDVVDDPDQTAWRARYDTELEHRFDPASEPPLRVALFRVAPARTVVLATFLHALGDAKSASLLLLEILRGCVTEGAEPPARSVPRPMEALYPWHARGLVGRLRMLLMLLRGVAGMLRVGTPKRLTLATPERERRRAARVIGSVLEPPEAAALLARCRAEGTTVQGAVMAALLLAQRDVYGDEVGPGQALGTAVNMRPRLDPAPADEDLGYFISLPTTIHRVTGGEEFWGLARACRDQLARRLDRGEGHLFWHMFPPELFVPPTQAGADRLARVMAAGPQSSLITNIGNLGDGRIGDGLRIDALHFALAPGGSAPTVTAVASIGGRLFHNTVYDAERLPEPRARAVAERVTRYLSSA